MADLTQREFFESMDRIVALDYDYVTYRIMVINGTVTLLAALFDQDHYDLIGTFTNTSDAVERMVTMITDQDKAKESDDALLHTIPSNDEL